MLNQLFLVYKFLINLYYAFEICYWILSFKAIDLYHTVKHFLKIFSEVDSEFFLSFMYMSILLSVSI